MDPVVHFELPADDPKRMAAFYQKAFGWQTQAMGPEMGDYVLATTTPAGPDGRPTQPGGINGGFYVRDPKSPMTQPSVVVGVKDVKAAMKAITKAGGKVLGEPAPIPGVGLYAVFEDSEGNRLSILQPQMG